MPTNKVIQYLWDLGHFKNPAYPNTIVVTDLLKLKLTDQVVRDAIKSFQEFMVDDFDRLSLELNHRIGVTDGEIGPATTALFEVERCGLPDYGIEAAGSGSWPSGCHPEYPNDHSFAVYFDKSNMPGFWKPVWDQAWLLVRQAAADMGMAYFEVQDQNRANTVVTWTRGNGWIGLAVVPRSPKCRERIWAKFDTRYQPRDLVNQLARLLAHEFGHNKGFSHSRGGIMNPSIVTGVFRPNAWRGDPSESLWIRSFGGNPVTLIDLKPPTTTTTPDIYIPPQPPAPNEHWWRGSLDYMKGDEVEESFILVPKPKV